MMPKSFAISIKNRAAIRRRLLDWYHENKRDLPWRQTADPYHILLAEFMLQQTQVETVIPYYQRFLDRFPTLKHLAAASQHEVLKAWEGLGYYARARNLHRASQLIVERFAGTVPGSYKELASLPGFGPYTTAAVLSIAFGLNHAVLDGNVIRVLCRYFGIKEDTSQSQVKNHLKEHAQNILANGNAGDYNQAIMELGATICRPRSPGCTDCPLAQTCKAHQSGDPEALPFKSPRKARPHHILSVGIVWRKGTLLIDRRHENGLLGGLWEFPATRLQKEETLQACCLRGVRETAGIEAEIESRFRTVKHAFTHFTVTMHAFECLYKRGRTRALSCSEVNWVFPEALTNYAFSQANRKLIEYLLDDRSSQTV